MEVRPLESAGREEWDAHASCSPDAWFWHTTAHLDFVLEIGGARSIEDLSFFVIENGDVLAICPLFAEEMGGWKQFSYLGEHIPAPAFRPGLPEAKRVKTLRFIVETLASMAQVQGVEYVRVMTPALAPARFDARMPHADPLLRFGFSDVSAATQLIDLELHEDALWRGVRPGHRQDIKKAAALCTVHTWDRDSVTGDKFREYQELHQKDAGRVTRSERTFDLMLDWVRRERAVLVEASLDGDPIAFSLFMLFGAGAYYASSCKDPDHSGIPASHLIQWRTMLWLKERGYRNYDLGYQHFGASHTHVPSAKDIGISTFKRGFGGYTVRVPFCEFFYSERLLERRLEERRTSYLKTREPRD